MSILILSEWRQPIVMAAKLGVFRRREIVEIVLISLLAIALEAVGIGFMLPLLQYIEHGGNIAPLIAASSLWRHLTHYLSFVNLTPNLVILSGLVFVMLAARQIVAAARALRIETARARAARELSELCFSSILNAKGEYIQRIGSGNFSLVVASQAQSAASVIRNLAELLTSLLTLIGYAVVLAAIAVVPMLLAVVFGILIIMSNNWLVRMAHASSNLFVTEKAAFSQFLVERLNAWRLIKVSNSLPTEVRLCRRYVAKLTGIDVRLAKISNLSGLILNLGQAFVALLVLNIATGLLGIGLSSVTLLFLAMYRLMPVINGFGRLRHVNANIRSFISQVDSYVSAARAEREVETGWRAVPAITSKIEYDDVTFQHKNSEFPAVVGATLTIPVGKITAITGRSGAGKTTLVDMLPRLVVPEKGVIRIDGTPISEFLIASLRSAIHYVGQTPLFLNGTVLDNVRYAKPDASLEEVVAACHAAYAHEFIERMPSGYKTEIGEGGSRLSGGQKQRLAIARVFLSNASIVILDEPTSSLDYESEAAVSKALKALVDQRGATILIITHHASTMRNADFVAVMEAGKVVAVGHPSQLAIQDEWFAALAKASNDDTTRLPLELGTNG